MVKFQRKKTTERAGGAVHKCICFFGFLAIIFVASQQQKTITNTQQSGTTRTLKSSATKTLTSSIEKIDRAVCAKLKSGVAHIGDLAWASSIVDSVPYPDKFFRKVSGRYRLVDIEIDEGRHILFHKTKIADLVCNDDGEKRVSKVMLHVFRKYSELKTTMAILLDVFRKYIGLKSTQAIMLDIGANAGYYGQMAAGFGLHVVQFDSQPACIDIIQNNVMVNGFQDIVRVIPKGVSDRAGTVKVQLNECNGRSSVDDNGSGVEPEQQKDTEVEVHPLEHYIVDPSVDILLMKIDTDGNENKVLSGALPFFKNHRVKNAIVKFTPGYDFWQKSGVTRDEVAKTIKTIIDDFGYTMTSLANWETFTKGKAAVDYVLGTEAPGQFDVWLMPKGDLAKNSPNSVSNEDLSVKCNLEKKEVTNLYS